jgi:hypothetical protein
MSVGAAAVAAQRGLPLAERAAVVEKALPHSHERPLSVKERERFEHMLRNLSVRPARVLY